MSRIKTNKLGRGAFFQFSAIMGGWLLIGCLSGLNLFPGAGKKLVKDKTNHLASMVTQYGQSFFYRNTFDLESEMKWAKIMVASDDIISIYLNGDKIYSDYGDKFLSNHGGKRKKINMSTLVDLTPFLRQGKNVLGIENSNLSVRPPGGLAVVWEIQGRQWKKFSLPFFKGWKAKTYPTGPGWMRMDFNDSHWEAPSILVRKKETATSIPKPSLPVEFFFMLPKDYAPVESFFDVLHVWLFYCLLFFIIQYFFGKNFFPSYPFFQEKLK